MHERIKKICQEKGVSINKMEKDLGFSRSYIRKLNKSVPSVSNVKKIAEYLEVDINELL